MADVTFCIATLNDTVLMRWRTAMNSEGWKTASLASPAKVCSETRHELDLVEVCSALCKSPDDLRRIIAKRKPVATLAFAAQKDVSGTQITRFLDAGADDFLFSDTDERVLIAKIKAICRRLASTIEECSGKITSSCGGICIDRTKRRVEIRPKTARNPVLLSLTQKELDILSLLVGNEREVIPREVMLEKLWGIDAAEVYSNCINKHIELLRKKLGPLGRRIRTVYGSGYMFS